MIQRLTIDESLDYLKQLNQEDEIALAKNGQDSRSE